MGILLPIIPSPQIDHRHHQSVQSIWWGSRAMHQGLGRGTQFHQVMGSLTPVYPHGRASSNVTS
jgi:hypothetical protein